MISLLLLIAASLSATNAIYCPVGWKVTYGPRSPDRPDYIVPKCVPSGFKPPTPLSTVVPPKPTPIIPKPPALQKSAGFCPVGQIMGVKTVKILGVPVNVPACVTVRGFVSPKQQSAGFTPTQACPPGKKWGKKIISNPEKGISFAYMDCIPENESEPKPKDLHGNPITTSPVDGLKAKYDALKAKLEKTKQKLLAVLKKLIEKKKQLLAKTDTSVQSGSQGFSGILGQIMSKLDAETQKLLAECKTLDEALAKLEELKAKASVASGSQGFDPFLINFMAQLDEETRKFLSDAKTLDEALAKLEQLKAGAFVPPNQRSAGFCPPGKKWGLKNTIILGRVVPLPGCV